MNDSPHRRIHSVRVENVLGVELVELQPNASGFTIIAGKNGAGKSSVIRAIATLLDYRSESKGLGTLLRRGTEKGSTTVELDDGTTITRTNTESHTRIVVRQGNATLDKPQSFLDTIRPPDLLDPLAFSNMKPLERRELLIGVSGLSEELAEVQDSIAEAEERRREAGRTAKSHAAAYAEMPEPPPDTPDEKVSASDLVRQLDEMREQRATVEAAEGRERILESGAEAAHGEVARLRKELEEAEDRLVRSQDGLREAQKYSASLTAPTEDEENALRSQIDQADATNAAVDRKLAKAAAKERMAQAASAHEDADAHVKDVRAKRDALVGKATLPLEGLAFDDADATFNGVQWGSLGTAEQLRIGLALGAAQHPGLKVFLIQRAESLDADSFAAVQEWAEQEDAQIIAEVVGGEGHEGAFVIEAGRIAE